MIKYLGCGELLCAVLHCTVLARTTIDHFGGTVLLQSKTVVWLQSCLLSFATSAQSCCKVRGEAALQTTYTILYCRRLLTDSPIVHGTLPKHAIDDCSRNTKRLFRLIVTLSALYFIIMYTVYQKQQCTYSVL